MPHDPIFSALASILTTTWNQLGLCVTRRPVLNTNKSRLETLSLVRGDRFPQGLTSRLAYPLVYHAEVRVAIF
ncbi:hypothetical protein K504DRAFT_128913 [Pleomassaria siparia CBS 279.74]|uniref:Uncharacterized protein n=1 Tax=Pleomassaria siparia CBS 279.74 TaxID=1314801 RepID=A0A6G1KJQ2_9PLEO|nr:hypothetical protein K504DRAFT_128913 [Pleomassaria siparia CBS 279.74]